MEENAFNQPNSLFTQISVQFGQWSTILGSNMIFFFLLWDLPSLKQRLFISSMLIKSKENLKDSICENIASLFLYKWDHLLQEGHISVMSPYLVLSHYQFLTTAWVWWQSLMLKKLVVSIFWVPLIQLYSHSVWDVLLVHLSLKGSQVYSVVISRAGTIRFSSALIC